MSDAPETIWTCTHVGEYGYFFPDAVEAEGEYGGVGVEYRRTDLPATNEQAFANEKVKALVEKMLWISTECNADGTPTRVAVVASAALAAAKE